MYKLLLIDDEAEVRQGIISKIDWKEIGFEIVGEAENGLEALEIIDKLNPDVAIIDIKMPFMDGMELVERIEAYYPATKMMILSGFDEFDYAQKAIRYGVMDYVLKPFGSEELTEILLRLKALLDEEKMRNANLNALRQQYMESLPLLKERFFNALLSTEMPYEEIKEKANRFHLNLPEERYTVALIQTGFEDADDWKVTKEPFSMSLFEKKELHGYAVFETCERLLSPKGCLVSMRGFEETIVIIPLGIKGSIKQAFFLLEEVRMVVEKTHPLTVTIGIGAAVESATELAKAYGQAQTALEHRLVEGGNRLLFIDDFLPKNYGDMLFDEDQERALRSAVQAGHNKKIEGLLRGYFQRMRDEDISYQDCRLFINEMLTALLRIARTYKLNLQNLVQEDNLFLLVKEMTVLKSIEDWFVNACLLISQNIVDERVTTIQRLVETAKEHVKVHFFDQSLNLESMSQTLHISPSYFSRMFKKETGKTFIQYLTEIRMEKAAELVVTTDLKNFQIADQIGYAEANYFSYSFKKFYGQSPTAMRKQRADFDGV